MQDGFTWTAGSSLIQNKISASSCRMHHEATYSCPTIHTRSTRLPKKGRRLQKHSIPLFDVLPVGEASGRWYHFSARQRGGTKCQWGCLFSSPVQLWSPRPQNERPSDLKAPCKIPSITKKIVLPMWFPFFVLILTLAKLAQILVIEDSMISISGPGLLRTQKAKDTIRHPQEANLKLMMSVEPDSEPWINAY